MNSQQNSNKKSVDLQIFNKFSHISSESDKKIIHESQLLSCRIEASEVKKKIKTIEDAQKFIIKSQDQIYLLDIDPEKEKFVNDYRRNIFKMAMGKRKRQMDHKNRLNSMISINQSNGEIADMTTEYLEETVIEKQKIKLKIKQKLSLFLQNDKIKQVQQLGQIIAQGTQKQSAALTLHPLTLWSNPKSLSKRISPNSLQCNQTSQNTYTFTTVDNYKSKPLIDYVLKTETFNQDKIPLLFIYTMQVNSSNIQFTFKYKINQKWKFKIYEFDINVYLHKDFIVLDCKSIPAANSLKNNKVTWKTKEIVPGSNNSKGKILLAFSQAKFPPKDIISQIKLNMKSNCGLLEGLGAEVKQDFGVASQAEKLLLIEYRILPS